MRTSKLPKFNKVQKEEFKNRRLKERSASASAAPETMKFIKK